MKALEFKNKALIDLFSKKGYVIIDLPDVSVLAELEHLYFQTMHIKPDSFYYSLLQNSPQQNLNIKTRIHEILKDTYRHIFDNFVCRSSSYLIKPAHFHEEMFLHRDWSFTDVRQFQVGTLWIPLIDVNKQSGAMYVKAGSQVKDMEYISASIPTRRIPYAQIPLEQLTTLEVARGQAVIFNPQIWHGSFPNETSNDRVVYTTQIYPHEAPFLYFHKDESNNVYQIKLRDDDFILKNLHQMVFNKFDFSAMRDRVLID